MADPQPPAGASAPVMRDANGHELRVGDLVTVRVSGAWQKGWVRCIRTDPHHGDRVECLVTNGEQTDPKDELGTATFGAWIDKPRQIRWFRTPTPPLVALDRLWTAVLRQAGIANSQPHPPGPHTYGAADALALLAGGWLDTISMHEYAPGLFALANGDGDEVATGLSQEAATLFTAVPDLVRSVVHHVHRADDAEGELAALHHRVASMVQDHQRGLPDGPHE